MGSWDVSVFGNDEARAWVSDLMWSATCEPIFRALVSAAKVGPDEYLLAPDCERALAAAELVACARGKPVAGIAGNVKSWLADQRFVAGTQIVDVAIQVIDRIAANSELKELWQETDSAQDWLDTLHDLSERLQQTRESTPERSVNLEGGAGAHKHNVAELCEEAAVFVASHSYSEALAKYSQALSINPRSQKVLMGRAICCLWMGDYDRVIEDINKALSLGDPIPEAYQLRSQAYFHQKKYRNVVADLTSYLRANPDHTESMFIRGLAYQALEQLDNAVADFSAIIERNSPDLSIDAFECRAQCYDRMRRTDLAAWDRQRAQQLQTASVYPP